MDECITIGVDLAKNVFQIHGIDAKGKIVVQRQLRRPQILAFFGKQPPCLVGMEACATAHYRARVLPCVRPVGAVHLTAGPNALRKIRSQSQARTLMRHG